MAAFNFPDPTIQQTVTNPITGSTYQWKEPPGKWVITTKVRAVSDIIYEGDTPPTPRGEYKLWYSTDLLELYFWYEDVNGVGAWVPTSAPITMLEDLDEGLFEVRQLLNQVNSAAITNENDIILIRESLGKVNLQEVLDNGNTADKGAEFGATVKVKAKDTTDDGDPLFAVEGDQANGGTGINLLVARRHSAQGDQVRYYGPIVNNKEIITKEYVDAATSALDLEQVLTNGNVADKGAEFGGPVIIERNAGDSITFNVKGGVRNNQNEVVIGSMLHAYHDKDDLTKDSGVEYRGKIYNENNLVNKGYVDVTDEAHSEAISELQASVIVLQREIEELSEGINSPTPYKLITDKNDTQSQLRDGGMFFGDCPNGNLLEIGDDWSGICYFYADTKDLNSDFADFGPDTIDEGDLIEGISREGDGYFLLEVGALGDYDEGAGKKIAVVEARLIKASGTPGNSGDEYVIKAFRLNASGGIDLPTADERYVEVTGDKMTGTLETTNRILIRPNGQGANGKNNMLVVNQSTANGDGSIVRFQQDGEDIVKVQSDKSTLFRDHLQITHPTATDGTYLFSVKSPGLETGKQIAFRVTADGKVKAGHDTANPYIAEAANDVVTKAALDDAIAGVQGGSGGLFEPTTWTLDLSMDRDETTKGKFYADDDDFYMSTSNANNLTWVPGAAGGRTTNAWVTIYSTAGKLMHTYEVNKIYFKEKYGKKYVTEFDWAWHYKTNNLVDGEQYRIIVPGFLT